jgi:hypothetical protein
MKWKLTVGSFTLSKKVSIEYLLACWVLVPYYLLYGLNDDISFGGVVRSFLLLFLHLDVGCSEELRYKGNSLYKVDIAKLLPVSLFLNMSTAFFMDMCVASVKANPPSESVVTGVLILQALTRCINIIGFALVDAAMLISVAFIVTKKRPSAPKKLQ